MPKKKDPNFSKTLQDAARELLKNLEADKGDSELSGSDHPNIAASKYVRFSSRNAKKIRGKRGKKYDVQARAAAAKSLLDGLSNQALIDSRKRLPEPDVSTTALWNRLGDYGANVEEQARVRSSGGMGSAGDKRQKRYYSSHAQGLPSPEKALDPRRVPVNQGPPPRDFFMQGHADQSLAELGGALRSRGATKFDLQGYRGDLEEQPGVTHLRVPEGSNEDVGQINVRRSSRYSTPGSGATKVKDQQVRVGSWPLGRPDKSALRHELRHAIDFRAPETGRDSATDYSPYVFSTQGGIQRDIEGSDYHKSIPELRAEEVEQFRAWMRTRKVAPKSDLGFYNAIHQYLTSKDFSAGRSLDDPSRLKTAKSFLGVAAKYFAAKPKEKKRTKGRGAAKLLTTR